MNAVAFDTLAYVKRLRAAGMEPALAEAQAEALAGAVQANLATKNDIEVAKEQVLAEVGMLRTEFDQLRHDFNGLRGELRAEIRDSQLQLVKWFVPLLLGQTAAIVALVKLL